MTDGVSNYKKEEVEEEKAEGDFQKRYIEEVDNYYLEKILKTEGDMASKRAHLKKQVTHWMGKFRIVKEENNTLRKQIKTSRAVAGSIEKAALELRDELAAWKERWKDVLLERSVALCPEKYDKQEVMEKEASSTG